MEHDSGCPTIGLDTEAASDWLSENMWVIGILYLIAGPFIALLGTAWFPYVCATLISIFVIIIITSFSLSMNWMATTAGTVVVMCIALLLGVIAGMLVRRKIWVMVSLLGLVAGFFIGSFIYALIIEISGWEEIWAFWFISCTMAIIGLLLSMKLGKSVVMTGTSLVGSYMFMRSWTLFFPGHYPSEDELVSDDFDELETDNIFWVFVAMFLSCFLISLVF